MVPIDGPNPTTITSQPELWPLSYGRRMTASARRWLRREDLSFSARTRGCHR